MLAKSSLSYEGILQLTQLTQLTHLHFQVQGEEAEGQMTYGETLRLTNEVGPHTNTCATTLWGCPHGGLLSRAGCLDGFFALLDSDAPLVCNPVEPERYGPPSLCCCRLTPPPHSVCAGAVCQAPAGAPADVVSQLVADRERRKDPEAMRAWKLKKQHESEERFRELFGGGRSRAAAAAPDGAPEDDDSSAGDGDKGSEWETDSDGGGGPPGCAQQ